MRIPDVALKSIVYIGNTTKTGGFSPVGTGFLVSRQRSEHTLVQYLVTADHVRRGLKNDRDFAIRINNQKNVAEVLHSPPSLGWWHHPTDDSVDATVDLWKPAGALEDFSYSSFPTELFIQKSDLEIQHPFGKGLIGIGDEIFITGLFRAWKGRKRNTPIVRHGHLAMMADERFPTKNYGLALVHLVEAFATAGLSGSPVYVYETAFVPVPAIGHERENNSSMVLGRAHLLGLLHGSIPLKVYGEIAGLKKDKGHLVELGISLVVPSAQILDIIDQPKLLKKEDDMRQRIKRKRDGGAVETSIRQEPKKNRDKPIPPINRGKFFDALDKATKRDDK